MTGINTGINKKRHIVQLIFAIIFAGQLFSSDYDSIYFSFSHTDSTYTFYGNFRLVADIDCVLHICFNFGHIKALAIDASHVELIEEGQNWNKIKYTYQQFPFYKNESLWHRTINIQSSRVDFILISSKNNHFFMPRILSSSGYYKLNQLNGILMVEYYQECQLTQGYFTALQQNVMKNKAIDFLHLFKHYSQKQCKEFN